MGDIGLKPTHDWHVVLYQLTQLVKCALKVS